MSGADDITTPNFKSQVNFLSVCGPPFLHRQAGVPSIIKLTLVVLNTMASRSSYLRPSLQILGGAQDLDANGVAETLCLVSGANLYRKKVNHMRKLR